jgi:AraC-like DNA-binding protein
LTSIVADGDYRIPAHAHDHVELLLVLRGSCEIWIDDQHWRAGPGDVVVYLPGVQHEELVRKGPWRTVVLRFVDQGRGLPSGLPPVIRLPEQSRLQQLGEDLAWEANRPDRFSPLLIQAWLDELKVRLWRNLKAQPDSPMRLALAWLQANLDKQPRTAEIAEQVLMTENSLAEMFKRHCGCTPKQYAIRARLARAAERLVNTDDGIATIAEQLGYSSTQFFARQFKQHYGSSPTRYRSDR